MRQRLRFLVTVAGCCTVVVYVAGCGVTTSSGLAGNSPSVQSTSVPTGTRIPGQITSIPSGTPVPGQSTKTPIVTPSNSSTNAGGSASAAPAKTPTVTTSNSRTGVSVGFDIAFDLATATPWNDITEDNLFAIQTTAGSSLDTTDEGLSSVNVPQWVANVHSHHRLALITIGGIADQHWEIACDDTYRSAFVANLVNYMKSNGFDGIDLDIEDDTWSAQGPPSAAMTTCVEAITTAAHAATTASGARPLISEDVTTPWMGSWMAPFQSDVDQFNLMTYGDTCANQCSTFASDIQQTYSQGIPKAKMVLGIDLIDSYPAPGDCGNIAKYASQQGLAGVMVWDIHTDAVRNNGSFPCFDQLAPYVTPPGP
ncbi:MAG: glycosyl hydrolase family 18 protein [Ktedonobacterales bacterium]